MKKIAIMVMMILSLGATFIPAVPAFADTKSSVCAGVGLTGGSCDAPASGPTVDGVVQKAIQIMGILVGIIAVIMIIIGGLKYITSGGDSSKISSAKDTILYAVIGLVIAVLAQVIVRFVLTRIG